MESIYVSQNVDIYNAHIDAHNNLTTQADTNPLTDNNGRTTDQEARRPRNRPYARN